MKLISEANVMIKVLLVRSSKLQRAERTRIASQMQKNAKVPNFQENSLVLQMRTVGSYGTSRKEEGGYYEGSMKAQ